MQKVALESYHTLMNLELDKLTQRFDALIDAYNSDAQVRSVADAYAVIANAHLVCAVVAERRVLPLLMSMRYQDAAIAVSKSVFDVFAKTHAAVVREGVA